MTTLADLVLTKISELPAAAAALGTTQLPTNNAGASERLTVAQIQTLINAQPLDSDLTAIAALSTTAYGRAFLAMAGASDLTALTSGTAFPTGAALTAYGANRPFWRTDLGESCYHDGTRWLGPKRTLNFMHAIVPSYATDFRSIAANATQWAMAPCPAESFVITDCDFDIYDASANNNPMYWQLNLYSLTGVTTSSALARGDDHLLARNAYVRMNVGWLGGTPLVIAAGVNALHLGAYPQASAGAAYFTAGVTIRPIRT
jgi:hypothetical protein